VVIVTPKAITVWTNDEETQGFDTILAYRSFSSSDRA
jgi:hypothetical protein